MAESVPAKPAFSTQKLTKAEHQAVSSLEAIAPPRLVERRYSTMRGLAPGPGTSETPRSSSCIAMSNHGKAATGASGMADFLPMAVSRGFNRLTFDPLLTPYGHHL